LSYRPILGKGKWALQCRSNPKASCFLCSIPRLRKDRIPTSLDCLQTSLQELGQTGDFADQSGFEKVALRVPTLRQANLIDVASPTGMTPREEKEVA